METAVTIFLCGLIFTLLSWIIVPRIQNAHAVRRERDAQERTAAAIRAESKRVFRAAITALRDTIVAADDHKLVEAHRESLPRFREECAKIGPEIAVPDGFRASVNAYLALTEKDIQCPDPNEKRPPNKDRFGNYQASGIAWNPSPRPAIGRQRIKDLLNEVCDCCK